MSSPRTVLVSDADRVRTLSMHRPERLNAFDGSLVQGLAEALTAAAGASEISVVVLRGSGRAFSTGADLKALAEPRPPAGGEGGSGFDDLLHLLADFPKPLIMAVHGYAVGFGMTILAFADLVFMSTDTRMRCPFTELGAPTEAASSYLLPKLLGRQDAAWLLLSSEWITAAEAKEIGLAWRLCEPDELFDVAADHAGRLAARPVEGLKLVKNLLNAPDRAELAAAISRESAALKKFVASFPSRG
jgi:enoyl-CoA hydratase/carnithine racemase